MTEEAKARLRAAAAERKLKKTLRANTSARPAEEEREKEESKMGKKLKKPKKAKSAKSATGARPDSRADAFLPAKFSRRHGDKDHVFERDGDGWRLDGAEPVPLRKAMAKIVGEANAKATSFVKYFRADKIAVA